MRKEGQHSTAPRNVPPRRGSLWLRGVPRRWQETDIVSHSHSPMWGVKFEPRFCLPALRGKCVPSSGIEGITHYNLAKIQKYLYHRNEPAISNPLATLCFPNLDTELYASIACVIRSFVHTHSVQNSNCLLPSTDFHAAYRPLGQISQGLLLPPRLLQERTSSD